MPHFAIFLGALLILLAGTPSEAAGKRPTVSTPQDCENYDCEGGIICSCCYDDGCWICDSHPGGVLPDFYGGCQWEPAFKRNGLTKIRPGSNGVLDPGTGNPPPSFNPKPYSLPGGGVLSK